MFLRAKIVFHQDSVVDARKSIPDASQIYWTESNAALSVQCGDKRTGAIGALPRDDGGLF